MNLHRLTNKLQTALLRKGIKIKINQHQRWSDRSERMVTKFVVQELRNVEGRDKYVTILETYKMADIVKVLAGMMNGND